MDDMELLSSTEKGIKKFFANLTMPNLKTKKKYFIPDNTVELLINGPDYFTDIYNELCALGAGDFVYISGWWFAPDFDIGEPLVDVLKRLANNGVDVRVLAWASSFLMNNPKFLSMVEELQGMRDGILKASAAFVRDLRTEDALKDKAILTTLAHPMGGHHAKFVVIGTDGVPSKAYLGGCDFTDGRQYPPQDTVNGFRGWHDATVKVQGPATKQILNIYALLWSEQRSRAPITLLQGGDSIVSHSKNMPVLEQIKLTSSEMRTFPNDQGDVQDAVIQVLATIPNMTARPSLASFLSLFGKPFLDGLGVFEKKDFSFAADGIFNFYEAEENAISKAEDYIFIMDQAFTSFDVMDWINARLRKNPNLKVILLNGADPADPASDNLNEAVYNHLLKDLPAETVRDNIRFYMWPGVAVHGKVTIIDDEWCAIGSANSMRRSLFTDIELSVAIYDEDSVIGMRNKLWVYYSGLAPSNPRYNAIKDANEDFELALGLWNPAWKLDGDDADLLTPHPSIQLVDLTQPRGEVEFSSLKYDFMDPDSRYL
jgi:phosphatidylserine/phosphatidylglycerophosphate/cardiolipin synthase-like enzyme